MKVRELLDLIHANSDAIDSDAQVFIPRNGDLFEVLSAEVDADGDLLLDLDEDVIF